MLTDELYLWRDLLKVHEQFPMHLAFGGGDQVYSDAVWKTKALNGWCDLPNLDAKVSAEFSDAMEQEAIEFYANNYIDHLSPPSIAKAMASIPQLMCWVRPGGRAVEYRRGGGNEMRGAFKVANGGQWPDGGPTLAELPPHRAAASGLAVPTHPRAASRVCDAWSDLPSSPSRSS